MHYARRQCSRFLVRLDSSFPVLVPVAERVTKTFMTDTAARIDTGRKRRLRRSAAERLADAIEEMKGRLRAVERDLETIGEGRLSSIDRRRVGEMRRELRSVIRWFGDSRRNENGG